MFREIADWKLTSNDYNHNQTSSVQAVRRMDVLYVPIAGNVNIAVITHMQAKTRNEDLMRKIIGLESQLQSKEIALQEKVRFFCALVLDIALILRYIGRT